MYTHHHHKIMIRITGGMFGLVQPSVCYIVFETCYPETSCLDRTRSLAVVYHNMLSILEVPSSLTDA